MKKILVLALAMFALMGCSAQTTNNDANSDSLKIGVIQFGSHPSLDNCYTGVEQQLENSGLDYEIDFQNGNFDQATCDAIAKTMVSKNYDIIIPIATPAAISAYSATMGTDIPVVFVAVSDPIAAGIVDTLETVGGNTTGTSSVMNVEAQLDMIIDIQPDAKTIGVIYTTSEANSITDIARLKEAADQRGLKIESIGIQTSADIPQAATTLVTKVDAITNLTDNNVVNNLSTLLDIADSANIPVYGSEVEQVINGCIATQGIEYIAVGAESAKLAIKALNGEDVSQMAVTVIVECTPAINTDVMDYFGFEIPNSLQNAEMISK